MPREQHRRRRGGIVWQPHYEGFTTVAYHSGKAIAGISGPWSSQYVLIWWEHARPIRQVELFDSLEEAKQAVAETIGLGGGRGLHLKALLGALRRESAGQPQSSWLVRLGRWLLPRLRERNGQPHIVDHRRRNAGEETDLRGLNFRAVR